MEGVGNFLKKSFPKMFNHRCLLKLSYSTSIRKLRPKLRRSSINLLYIVHALTY